jgi:hypothetical protein
MLRSKFATTMTLCAISIHSAVLAAACTEGGGSGDTDGASINGRLFAQTSVDIAAATVTAP